MSSCLIGRFVTAHSQNLVGSTNQSSTARTGELIISHHLVQSPHLSPLQAAPAQVDLGNIEGAYVHDPTGDATLSRFELFKQRKAAEAAQGR